LQSIRLVRGSGDRAADTRVAAAYAVIGQKKARRLEALAADDEEGESSR